MSGFTWDGATYDSAVYASPTAPSSWVVAGRTLVVSSHTREPAALTIDVRVRDETDRQAVADLKADAGEYRDRVLADGTTQARDTVGGSNTVTVRPPARLQPPRIRAEYLVDDVRATRTSPSGDAERATVTLIPRESRPLTSDANGALLGATGRWEVTTALGTIATDRVSSEITNDGDTVTLTLALTPPETDVLEASAAATEGVVFESLPDETTRTRDTTPRDRQTVALTAPTASPVASGPYAVSSWATDSVSSARHQVTITLDAL
jgi:hypothetical protein